MLKAIIVDGSAVARGLLNTVLTDGVPGVSKVGMKTAARLLNAYGDLDAVMAGAGILKTPLGERLRAEREILDVSRKLVQLKTDVRLGVTWNMLTYEAH